MIVTNGSMQADAFLFDTLVREGDAVDRREADIRPHAARPARARRGRADGRAPARRHRHRRDARAARAGAAPAARAHHPQLPEPRRLHAVDAEAQGLLELAREHGFTLFEDDPYIDIRFTGEPLPTMLSMNNGDARVVYASSFSKTVCPGIRCGYLVGPEDLIAQIAKRATKTYISPEHGRPVDRLRVLRLRARSSTRSRPSRRRSRSAARRWPRRSSASFPRRVLGARGRLLHVGRAARGPSVHALFDAAAERGVQIVKGTDFLLEGGENTLRIAYSGVTPEQIDEGVGRLAEAIARSSAVTRRPRPAAVALAPSTSCSAARRAAAATGRRSRYGLGDAGASARRARPPASTTTSRRCARRACPPCPGSMPVAIR